MNETNIINKSTEKANVLPYKTETPISTLIALCLVGVWFLIILIL